MPDFPIVDAHVHLWDPRRFRIAWLDGTPLDKPFGLAEYDEATAGLTVDSIVYLQVEVAPAYALLEAKAIVDLAATDQRIKGIVPWAPLEDGECIRSYLDALVTIGDGIKGVRRLTQDEPDPAFCLQPGFIKGTQILPEYGLSCDLCCRHTQLANTVEFVRQCPETAFVLDHIAKPNIREGGLDPWQEHMTAMAAFPNVTCKISGVVTEAQPQSWTVDDIRPYVHHALTAFGEDRVLFGGDWPVVLNASSYVRWVDALDEITKDFSLEAKRKLWADNARKFYRLPAA
jgi:predicted TIM-barrel fold metal-dependent hydrolase